VTLPGLSGRPPEPHIYQQDSPEPTRSAKRSPGGSEATVNETYDGKSRFGIEPTARSPRPTLRTGERIP